MSQLNRGMGLVALVIVLSAGAAQSEQSTLKSAKGTTRPTKANPDALVLQDFKHRVEQYVELHKKAAKKSPPLKETTDTAKIKAAQQVLADTIQSARTGARRGDIFTPAVSRKFKQLMYTELKGPDARETKKVIKEDAPSPAVVPLKVNTHYPEAAPLSTVPPNLLERLPQLPPQVDYRIVGKALLLRDVDANLIVDYIPNAIQ